MSIFLNAFAPFISKVTPSFNQGLVALVAVVGLLSVLVYSRTSISYVLNLVRGKNDERKHRARYEREQAYRTYRKNRATIKYAAKHYSGRK